MLSRKAFAISKTMLLCLVFFATGSIVSILGPTITSLSENLQRAESLNKIFIFRSIGFMIGAMLTGVLLHPVKTKSSLLVIESLLMGVLIIGVGFCTNSWEVYLLIFFTGMVIQSLTAGICLCLLNMWGRQMSSYYQTLHFAFGAGAFFSPLISVPFIEDTKQGNYSQNIVWAYVIVGCVALSTSIIFLLFSLFTWKEGKRYVTRSITSIVITFISTTIPQFLYNLMSHIFVLIAVFFELSVEVSYAQCVASYVIKDDLRLSRKEASFVTSAFWGSYMVSRFIMIFITNRVNVRYVILESCLFMLAAGFILVFWGYNQVAGLWIGTAFVGWGCGPLFPATAIWLSENANINFSSVFFFLTRFLAEMILPYFILENVNTTPRLLYYWVLSGAAFASFFFTLLMLMFAHTRRIQDRYYIAPGDQLTVIPAQNPPADAIVVNVDASPVADVDESSVADVEASSVADVGASPVADVDASPIADVDASAANENARIQSETESNTGEIQSTEDVGITSMNQNVGQTSTSSVSTDNKPRTEIEGVTDNQNINS